MPGDRHIGGKKGSGPRVSGYRGGAPRPRWGAVSSSREGLEAEDGLVIGFMTRGVKTNQGAAKLSTRRGPRIWG